MPSVFFIILAAFFSVCIFTYLYLFSRRVCKIFEIPLKEKRVKLARLLIALGISALSVVFFGYGIVFLLYMALADGLLSIIYAISAKYADKEKKGFRLWKKIFGSGALQVTVSIIIVIFGYFNFHNVQKTEYTVYTDKDIREEGYKVAFISDVHFGISLDLDELSEVCQKISLEAPDLVVLGGDIVDNSTPRESLRDMFETFGKIESNYGVYYIFGNHDRPMRMAESEFSEGELVSAIEDAGIVILQDEVKEINEDFALVGRDDAGFERRERKDIADLIAETEKVRFILSLDHQPKEYYQSGVAGVDLILSGHTHGGQVWPVNILDEIFKFNEANYGYVEIDKDTKAIVSSGLAGWGFSVKTSAPAEYVIVNIKKG